MGKWDKFLKIEVCDYFSHFGGTLFIIKMTENRGGNYCGKNDKKMTGVLYGGVQKFWVRRCIIITTQITFENFKGENCAFVTKWLEKKGLLKVTSFLLQRPVCSSVRDVYHKNKQTCKQKQSKRNKRRWLLGLRINHTQCPSQPSCLMLDTYCANPKTVNTLI